VNDDRSFSLQRLFPSASAGLLQKFARAAQVGVEPVDFYTIRDLQDLSGYHDEELALLLLCLFLALREGSVCVELESGSLARRLEGIADAESAQTQADAILGALKTRRYSELIGTQADESKPIIRPANGRRELLYFQKYLRHERALKVLLEKRLSAPPPTLTMKALQPLFKSTLAAHAQAGIEFSPEQKLAIGLTLLCNFVIISGGPGTGKTSVVFALLNCLILSGTGAERIQLACPTGRAAQRLTESLRAGAVTFSGSAAPAISKLSAQTMHRLLGYNPRSGTFGHHCENHIPADVLIIDEVSMLDIVLMSRFLEAAAPHTKIILLGDKDQLPSVDAGSVLADLMPLDGEPGFRKATRERLLQLTGIEPPGSPAPATARLPDTVVILKKNFRSQQQITEIARGINELKSRDAAGARALLEKVPALKLNADASGQHYTWPRQCAGCNRLEHPHDSDHWRAILDAWADFHYVDGGETGVQFAELTAQLQISDDGAFAAGQQAAIASVFAVVNGARVLMLMREGVWGCEGVNLHLARRLAGSFARRGSAGLFPGAPVLITANDYALELFNGDVGVTLKTGENALRVVFERQDDAGRRRYISLPIDVLPQHELAYAITVHKSQGSEYGQVLLALPPEAAQRLQNRQLIYTAITRARNAAFCYGELSVFSAAVARTLERCSGLAGEFS
jgi:exodeoxyribonuclease V alpha subunit